MQCTHWDPLGTFLGGKSQLLSEHSTLVDQARPRGKLTNIGQQAVRDWGGEDLVKHWSACESGQCGTLFACRTLQAPMHNVIQLAVVASGVVGNKCRCKTGATTGGRGAVLCARPESKQQY